MRIEVFNCDMQCSWSYVWNTTYHLSSLVFCAHVLRVTHHINVQIA